VGVQSPTASKFFNDDPVMEEPATGWRKVTLSTTETLIAWEAGITPVVIPAKDVGQFRMKALITSTKATEALTIIHALTSEGKMTAIYTVSAYTLHPTMNLFYTNNIDDPLNNWGYLIKGIKSGTNDQIFNATLENASDNTLSSEAMLIILLPADFSDVKEYEDSPDWDDAVVVTNPDGSHVITVNTTATTMTGPSHINFRFTADVPSVTETKLYVFQTTSVYPGWDNPSFKEVQLASALSEAGVEVIP